MASTTHQIEVGEIQCNRLIAQAPFLQHLRCYPAYAIRRVDARCRVVVYEVGQLSSQLLDAL